MKEIKALNSVISTLENQARSISEFSGIISEINAIKDDIKLCEESIKKANDQHSSVILETRNLYDLISTKISSIESAFLTLAETHNDLSNKISSLDVVTKNEFFENQSLRDRLIIDRSAKIETQISSLNFITKDEFSENQKLRDRLMLESFAKIEKLVDRAGIIHKYVLFFVVLLVIISIAFNISIFLPDEITTLINKFNG